MGNDLERFGRQFEEAVLNDRWLPADKKHHVLHVYWTEAQKYQMNKWKKPHPIATFFYALAITVFLIWLMVTVGWL